MPAQLAHIDTGAQARRRQVGEQVRRQRIALRIRATAAAEAAGMSRVISRQSPNRRSIIKSPSFLVFV